MNTALKEKFGKILAKHGISARVQQVILEGNEGLAGEHFGSVCQFVTGI